MTPRAWLAALALLPAAAAAQIIIPEDEILLGAGVRARPAYDGSGDQTVDLIPLVRYYGKPWFARTTQGILEGGARVPIHRDVDIGVQLAYEEGRKQSESDLLKRLGVEDLDPGLSLGVHAEWDTKIGPAPVSLLGRWRQHLDSDRGAQADLRFNVGVYGNHGVIAALYAQATWASSKSIRSFYLVDAGSGLLHTSLGALGSYDFNRHWLAFAGVQWRTLHGDAASSPLVEEKTSFYANAGVAYRF
jgi:outer membrane scaffolding protein for murein synthesis (MipA/OmpV family)